MAVFSVKIVFRIATNGGSTIAPCNRGVAIWDLLEDPSSLLPSHKKFPNALSACYLITIPYFEGLALGLHARVY